MGNSFQTQSSFITVSVQPQYSFPTASILIGHYIFNGTLAPPCTAPCSGEVPTPAGPTILRRTSLYRSVFWTLHYLPLHRLVLKHSFYGAYREVRTCSTWSHLVTTEGEDSTLITLNAATNKEQENAAQEQRPGAPEPLFASRGQ